MRENELRKIQDGFYGDCILVDGNPLEDTAVLQDYDKVNVILIKGRVYKAGRKEYVALSQAGKDHNIVPEFPQMKMEI